MEILAKTLINNAVMAAKAEMEMSKEAQLFHTKYEETDLVTQVFYDLYKKIFDQDPLFGTSIFTAPAASQCHQNYKGGWLEHSAKLALFLTNRINRGDLTMSKIQATRIAFLHDLCKINTYNFVGKEIITNQDLKKKHACYSLELCAKYDIQLTAIERVCIAAHMDGGFWSKEDEEYIAPQEWYIFRKEISATQWADMKACE